MNTQKIKDKKKINKKIKIFIIIPVVIIVTVLFFLSPIFAVKNIVFINETDTSSKEEILNILENVKGKNGFLYIYNNVSGIKNIDYFFSMRAKSIEDQITLSLPKLKKVKIKYDFPGTLSVSFGQRYPEYLIDVSGSYICADIEGFIIDIDINKDNSNLPIIKGLDITECKLGRQFQTENGEETVHSILKNIFNKTKLIDKENNKLKLLERIEMIDIFDYNNIWMFLYGNVSVEIGKPDNLDHKITQLKEILLSDEIVGKQGHIDLKSPNPVFKEKQ